MELFGLKYTLGVHHHTYLIQLISNKRIALRKLFVRYAHPPSSNRLIITPPVGHGDKCNPNGPSSIKVVVIVVGRTELFVVVVVVVVVVIGGVIFDDSGIIIVGPFTGSA